jgi:hypothetical protein
MCVCGGGVLSCLVLIFSISLGPDSSYSSAVGFVAIRLRNSKQSEGNSSSRNIFPVRSFCLKLSRKII